MATAMFPASSTTCPSASNLASSPATRTADGPMSTPRRDCPRSSGTPMTRIFLGVMLENDAVDCVIDSFGALGGQNATTHITGAAYCTTEPFLAHVAAHRSMTPRVPIPYRTPRAE